MSQHIHSTALIAEGAVVHPSVSVGAYSIIGPDVEIGEGTCIGPHCVIEGHTRIGRNNQIFQFASLGAQPQDKKYAGEPTRLEIGDGNTIRENVVINRATHVGGKTIVGNENFLMEGSQISHDTHIGHCNVFGYGTKIAGSCEIGNGVIFSSSVIENGGTRVGDLAMIQAGTRFSKDVPPYIIAGGNPIAYAGPNTTMMSTRKIEERIQKHVANAYRLLFHGQNSAFDSMLQIKEQVPDSNEIRNIVDFIKTTDKGIISKL